MLDLYHVKRHMTGSLPFYIHDFPGSPSTFNYTIKPYDYTERLNVTSKLLDLKIRLLQASHIQFKAIYL